MHIIADNLSIHKQKDVKEWLDGKRKIQLHFTPTYSSWLNQAYLPGELHLFTIHRCNSPGGYI